MSTTSDLVTYNISLSSANVIVQQSATLTITVPPGSALFDDAAAIALAAALEAACPASLGLRGFVNKSEIVQTVWDTDTSTNPPSFT